MVIDGNSDKHPLKHIKANDWCACVRRTNCMQASSCQAVRGNERFMLSQALNHAYKWIYSANVQQERNASWDLLRAQKHTPFLEFKTLTRNMKVHRTYSRTFGFFPIVNETLSSSSWTSLKHNQHPQNSRKFHLIKCILKDTERRLPEGMGGMMHKHDVSPWHND